MTGKCCSCYETVENKIGGVFEKLGQLISCHPWKIIIVVVLVNGLLGIGMIRLETDIDVSRVYTPENSQAAQDESKIQAIFPDKSGSDFYSHQLVIDGRSATVLLKPNGGNILNVDFLDQVIALDTAIKSVAGNNDGAVVNYGDICALRNSNCVVSGSLFLSTDFRSAVQSNNVAYPYFTLSSGEVVSYSTLVSGAEVAGGLLTKATHLKLTYYLRSDTNAFTESAAAWQEAFVEKMESYSNDKFDFAFGHSDSLSEELNSNLSGDIKLFSVTFTLMITFACCATYSARHDCIGNRVFLGFAGVLAAGLSIIASFGLVSACGMSFVSIVGNLPFLIIGIGVDDMFILLSGLSDALYDGDTKSRIGQMLRTSGVAITITSLTDILAFGAGISSSFKSVRNFCTFTGVAVLFCYLNQTLFFSSCLTLNEKRVNDKRHVFCCRKTKSKAEMKSKGVKPSTIFCCAGTPPERREDVEGFPEKIPRIYLSKLVQMGPVKIIVLIVFAVYLGISIWGAINLKQGLVIKDLVAQDSYYYKYRTWQEDHFSDALPVSFVIDQTYDYSDAQIQTYVENIIINAKADGFMSNDIDISWLSSYKAEAAYYDGSSEAAFVAGLNSFLADPRYARFTHDVVISGGSITASRVYAFTNKISSSQDDAQMMLNMRKVASDSPLSATAFAPAFIFYEQYIAILPQTLQTLGIGVAAVFLITAIFMPHPLLLLYVVFTMGMIMVGIVGFMAHWNLTLSSITMIHLIMSVGFSVDFTAHICHAYMVANGDTRNDRVAEAMKSAGGPIFNGAVSSILGILMLAFAKSYIFKSFFQVMLLVVLFGSAHALFFLPVLLSLIGPTKSEHRSSSPKVDPKNQREDTHESMHQLTDIKTTKSPRSLPVVPSPTDKKPPLPEGDMTDAPRLRTTGKEPSPKKDNSEGLGSGTSDNQVNTSGQDVEKTKYSEWIKNV